MPDCLEIDAVVPQCLDNQYVSDEVFSRMQAKDVDYRDEAVLSLRERDFRTEFARSLIYSSQVVIQRAFLRNSDFLYKNYVPEARENLAAFARLVREQAIVPFLFREESLVDDLEFDVSSQGGRAMRALLGELGDDVTCVRLASTREENERLTGGMGTEFGSRLSRLEYMTEVQRNTLASELFTDPGALQQAGAWQRFNDSIDGLVDYLVRMSRQLRRAEGRLVTRQDVYRDNFAYDGKIENVVLGRFRKPDRDNPFLLQLKKYVDLVYNTNLPDHLGRYTFTPANMPTRLAMQDSVRTGHSHEQLSSLFFNDDVLESIRRTFLARAQQAMDLPLLRDLSMADIVEVRSLPEWGPFQEAQARILRDPLRFPELIQQFQEDFDRFQRSLSHWYNIKYGRRRTERQYCTYVALAISLAGKLAIVGSDLSLLEKTLALTALSYIPRKVQGYTVKLMIGVYDVGRSRLDRDHTYSIELMRTNAELTRSDVLGWLETFQPPTDGAMPGTSLQTADQGIK